MKTLLYRLSRSIIRFLHRRLETVMLRRWPDARRDEYALRWPQFQTTYAPWGSASFAEVYRPIRQRTVVKKESCYYIHCLSMNCVALEGDFAEAGVYRGGTAYLIAQNLARGADGGRLLRLFDTFEGMPGSADTDPSDLARGDFGDTSLEGVRELLRGFDFVSFHKGRIPDTFAGLDEGRYAFVHIDVDLYDSTLDCLSYFYRRTVRGGVILFDDYGYPKFVASERRAADEFFADKPEKPIALPTGQAFVVKT